MKNVSANLYTKYIEHIQFKNKTNYSIKNGKNIWVFTKKDITVTKNI